MLPSDQYLDRPTVRAQFGVDPAITANFSSCNDDVLAAFMASMDKLRPTYLYVAALFERGVCALIYVGKNDWSCNHVGNEAWTRALEWTGRAQLAGEPLRAWNINGTVAGMTRSARGLTTKPDVGHC